MPIPNFYIFAVLTLSAFITIGLTQSAQAQISNSHTLGPCSPVIGVVNGTVHLNCGTSSNKLIVPVFSGLIAENALGSENDDFVSFLNANKYKVVFLRMYVSHRDYTYNDISLAEAGYCEIGTASLFSENGSHFPIANKANFAALDSIDFNADGNFDDSYDKLVGKGIFEYEVCSEFALLIKTSRAKRWDDNGVEFVGFFLVDPSGGHMTRTLITLEEQAASASDWNAASSLLPAAEDAREARITEWWNWVEQVR